MTAAKSAWLITVNWPKNENAKPVEVKLRSFLASKKHVSCPNLAALPFGTEKFVIVPHEHLKDCLTVAIDAAEGRYGWRPYISSPPRPRPTTQVFVSVTSDVPHTITEAALAKVLRTRRVALCRSVQQERHYLFGIEDHDQGQLLAILSGGLIMHGMQFEVLLSEACKTSSAETKIRHLPSPQLPTRNHTIGVQTDEPMETSPLPRPAKRQRAEGHLRPPKDTAKKTASSGASSLADAPRPPRQCWKCQAWGHEISSCEGTDRCRKCAGHHKTSACDGSPLQCANCAQQHASTSASCPLRPQQQQQRVKVGNPSKAKRPPAPTTRRSPRQRQPDLSSLVSLLLLQTLERLTPPLLPRRPRRRRGKKPKPKASN